jgi:hypothetical protein
MVLIPALIIRLERTLISHLNVIKYFLYLSSKKYHARKLEPTLLIVDHYSRRIVIAVPLEHNLNKQTEEGSKVVMWVQLKE